MSYHDKLIKVLFGEAETQMGFDLDSTYPGNKEDILKRIKNAVLKHSASKLLTKEHKNGNTIDKNQNKKTS